MGRCLLGSAPAWNHDASELILQHLLCNVQMQIGMAPLIMPGQSRALQTRVCRAPQNQGSSALCCTAGCGKPGCREVVSSASASGPGCCWWKPGVSPSLLLPVCHLFQGRLTLAVSHRSSVCPVSSTVLCGTAHFCFWP